MRLLAALWTKEWLALARDVHGLAVLFLMPAAFVVVMSLALTDAFQPSAARPATFTILGGSSPLAARLADSLAGEGFRAVPAPADEMAAREQLRRGSLALAVLLASGFDSSPGPGSVTVLADPAVDAVQLAAFRQRLAAATLGIDLKLAPGPSVEVLGSVSVEADVGELAVVRVVRSSKDVAVHPIHHLVALEAADEEALHLPALSLHANDDQRDLIGLTRRRLRLS